MAEEIRRPGGAMAKRPLNFFWVVDCSGSMMGDKIQQVNYAIQSTIPDMRDAAEGNTNAELLVQAMKFSSGASWITPAPVKIEDYSWTDLTASGLTELGKALDLLCAQLTIPPMSERALPPVIVLLSDGVPTDTYKPSLDKLLHLPWGKKAVKIAIAIGRDADRNVLQEFTGNSEYVLDANNPQALVAMIRWASTVASQVSQPSSRMAVEAIDSNVPNQDVQAQSTVIDTFTLPDDFGEIVW